MIRALKKWHSLVQKIYFDLLKKCSKCINSLIWTNQCSLIYQFGPWPNKLWLLITIRPITHIFFAFSLLYIFVGKYVLNETVHLDISVSLKMVELYRRIVNEFKWKKLNNISRKWLDWKKVLAISHRVFDKSIQGIKQKISFNF